MPGNGPFSGGVTRRAVVAATVAVGIAGVAMAMAAPLQVKEYARALWFMGAPRPAPDGPFAVGRREVALTLPSWGRVTVVLWYPAAASQAGSIDRAWLRLRNPTSAPFSENAPWAEAQRPFPLIVHFPSWFGRAPETSFNLAELASHGYVVAALDDIIHLNRREGVAGKLQTASFDVTSPAAFRASQAPAAQRAGLEARFGQDVLDALLAHPLTGSHIDANRIGASGFSFGGAAALELSLADPRIRAVANLDGLVLGEAARVGVLAPYLFLSADIEPPTAGELNQPDLAARFDRMLDGEVLAFQKRQAAKPDNFTFFIKETSHLDFTDRLLMPAFAQTFHPSRRDRSEIWRQINGRLLAFFDRYVAAQPEAPGKAPSGAQLLKRSSLPDNGAAKAPRMPSAGAK
ncbi:alpha/beta hydrolase family protein [Camelimonas sp. ID_303_24]